MPIKIATPETALAHAARIALFNPLPPPEPTPEELEVWRRHGVAADLAIAWAEGYLAGEVPLDRALRSAVAVTAKLHHVAADRIIATALRRMLQGAPPTHAKPRDDTTPFAIKREVAALLKMAMKDGFRAKPGSQSQGGVTRSEHVAGILKDHGLHATPDAVERWATQVATKRRTVAGKV